MRFSARLAALPLVLASATAPLVAAAPARAATGQVVVFQVETLPLEVYNDPRGCTKLPLAAHVLNNQTDQVVRIYGDPFCFGSSVTVRPGHGSHVPAGSGSFSAA
ncbi:hypothetical protein ACIBK9_37810 [Nonomuraea sp. NPDC050227]|uniref:hypothetical protein n=1 Tax=Nonomuraea sp. NPDC050227 TaxID=3364360 RepID=UPI00378FA129